MPLASRRMHPQGVDQYAITLYRELRATALPPEDAEAFVRRLLADDLGDPELARRLAAAIRRRVDPGPRPVPPAPAPAANRAARDNPDDPGTPP